MHGRKISGRYLSERVPNLEAERRNIDASGFAVAIERFINDYLRGAAEVEVCGSADGTINVSEAYTAYLLRSLILYSEPDEMLYLKIELGERITLKASFATLPAKQSLAHTVEIAKAAGYKVSRDNSTLFFTAEICSDKALQIYAISIDDFVKELENIIFM